MIFVQPEVQLLSCTNEADTFLATLCCIEERLTIPEGEERAAFLSAALKKALRMGKDPIVLQFASTTFSIKADMGTLNGVCNTLSEDRSFLRCGPWELARHERQLLVLEPEADLPKVVYDEWLASCERVEKGFGQLLQNGCAVPTALSILPKCVCGKVVIQASLYAWLRLLTNFVWNKQVQHGLIHFLSEVSPTMGQVMLGKR